MPSGIDPTQRYTGIRGEVLKNLKSGDSQKGLRFAEGKGLYIHASGNDGNKLWRFWNRNIRQTKFDDASQKIKESLNKEFGSVKINDREVKVGDYCFTHLDDVEHVRGGSKNKLTTADFARIDSLVSNLMSIAAEQATDCVTKEEFRHTSWIFGVASRGYLTPDYVNNWSKYVNGRPQNSRGDP